MTRLSRALRAAFIPALLVGAVTLNGCDSSESGVENGSFNARVTGDQTLSLNGLAGFATDTQDGEPYFAIGLANGTSEETADGSAVVLVAPGTPDEGEYQFSADEDAEAGAIFSVATDDEEGLLYLSDDGSFTITNASSERVRGTFEFHAVNFMDETDAVSVTGSFDAREGEVETSALRVRHLAAAE